MEKKKRYLVVYYIKDSGITKAVGTLYSNNAQEACKKAHKARIHLKEEYKEEILYETFTGGGFGTPDGEWADWLCNININDPLRAYSVEPFPT